MPPCAKYSEMSTMKQSSPLRAYTLSLNLVVAPAFFPTLDGLPSVARLTARDQSTPTLSSAAMKEPKMSSAVVVSITGTNSRNSSVTVNVSSTHRINIASWATSVMSVLSSITTENAINDLHASFNKVTVGIRLRCSCYFKYGVLNGSSMQCTSVGCTKKPTWVFQLWMLGLYWTTKVLYITYFNIYAFAFICQAKLLIVLHYNKGHYKQWVIKVNKAQDWTDKEIFFF